MLAQFATLGPLGRLPVFGGFLAAAAGFLCAVAIHAATAATPGVLVGCWAVLLALTMAAVPKALAAGVPPRQIVADRFAGIWLATAPVLPLAGLAATGTLQPGLLALALPLLIYHGLLAGPLRRMGGKPRALPLIADDLIAGALTLLLLATGLFATMIATSGAIQ